MNETALIAMWNWLEAHPNLYHVVLLVLAAIVINLFSLIIIQVLLKRSRNRNIVGMQYFLQALRRPLLILIWYLAFLYACAALADLFADEVMVVFNKLAYVGVYLTLGWFLFRLIGYYEKRIATREFAQHLDRTTADGMIKLVRITVVIIFTLCLLQVVGVPLTAIYTAAGGAGIGLTLAAQDLLKNFFGGMVLYFDRPFNIGDWIAAIDNSFEGVVEKIGWRTTRILTFERRPLYIPNATFLTMGIQNPSRMLNRRLKVDIGIRYEDVTVLPKITQDIETILKQHADIDQTQLIWVNLVNLGDSSLTFRLYAFTKSTDTISFQKTQEDILLKALDIIAKYEAQTAAPNTIISIPDPIEVKWSSVDLSNPKI